MSKDERKFYDVVQTIKGAEDDVDKVLEAARLLRHEGESRKLNAEQKAEIIDSIIFSLTVFGIMGAIMLLVFIMR